MGRLIQISSTPIPQSMVMPVAGVPGLELSVHELADGGLLFKLALSDKSATGMSVESLQFDFGASDLLARLSAVGRNVQNSRIGRAGIGRGFVRGADAKPVRDIALTFSRPVFDPEIGFASLRQTEFVLSHDHLCLTLADIDGLTFDVRLAPLAANAQHAGGQVASDRFSCPPAAAKSEKKPGPVFGGLWEDLGLPDTDSPAATRRVI